MHINAKVYLNTFVHRQKKIVNNDNNNNNKIKIHPLQFTQL